jgi:hypothetical protein
VINLTRLPEPEILTQKKAKWLAVFLASKKKRPASGQYAHKTVVETLAAMSNWRCFYCEQSLKDRTPEVDHYVDLQIDSSLAFAWTNLYLACKECNGKLRSILISQCLDPCDASVDPADHLTFDDELIRPRNESACGANTIRKYKLDRPDLDYKRSKELKRFLKASNRILQKMHQEKREMATNERDILNSFAGSQHPFSLMFRRITIREDHV